MEPGVLIGRVEVATEIMLAAIDLNKVISETAVNRMTQVETDNTQIRIVTISNNNFFFGETL